MDFLFDPYFQFVYVIIVGLMVGSFVNVLIVRTPKDESIISPPSHCPKCNNTIRWYDNMPIISYIMLGGRCRHCKEPISIKYPMVEFITAALFALLLYTYISYSGRFDGERFLAPFLTQIAMITMLIAIAFVDLEHRIIKANWCVIGTIIVIALSAWQPYIQGYFYQAFGITKKIVFVEHQVFIENSPNLNALFSAIAGAAAGTILFLLLRVIGSAIFKKEALGMGDVYLMALIGSLIGWKGVVLVFFIAPIPGAIIGIIYTLITKDHQIPYGPFLIFASFLLLYFPAFFYGWFNKVLTAMFPS